MLWYGSGILANTKQNNEQHKTKTTQRTQAIDTRIHTESIQQHGKPDKYNYNYKYSYNY